MAIEEKILEGLKQARKFAEEGDVKKMTATFDELFSERDTPEYLMKHVRAIENLGYNTKISLELKQAKRYAEAGAELGMEFCITFARDYAETINRNISSEIEEIKKLYSP